MEVLRFYQKFTLDLKISSGGFLLTFCAAALYLNGRTRKKRQCVFGFCIVL